MGLVAIRTRTPEGGVITAPSSRPGSPRPPSWPPRHAQPGPPRRRFPARSRPDGSAAPSSAWTRSVKPLSPRWTAPHGREDRRRHLLSAVAARIPPPGEELGLRQPIPVSHLADRGGVALRHDPRLRLGAPSPTPPSPGQHLYPAGDRRRQHIITKHHQHTKPVVPPRGPDAVIRSAPKRCGQHSAYLTALLTVLDSGEFRAASRTLDSNASAVSRRMRALEDQLGISLFERLHTGARLTNVGREFCAEARHIVFRLQEAIRHAGAAGTATTGSLRLGISGSLTSRFVKELIHEFRVECPNVRLAFREGSYPDHLASINMKQLDAALVLGTPAPTGCDVQYYFGAKAPM